jgi:HTH-type transcriptional regulator / antitoxin MqsA
MDKTAIKCADCGCTMLSACEPVEFTSRGDTVTVSGIEHLTCSECGEVLLDLDAARRLQTAAADQMRAARGLLQSGEIRALRHSLGLSQAAFERLLGTGPKTVVRWEKGTVFQSATADRLMRLVQAIPEAASILGAVGAERAGRPQPAPSTSV